MKVLALICLEWSHDKVSSKEHIKEYHIKALLNRFRLSCHTLKCLKTFRIALHSIVNCTTGKKLSLVI